ncbi:unnamed protein product, partial [Amoebophrya sp. A25]
RRQSQYTPAKSPNRATLRRTDTAEVSALGAGLLLLDGMKEEGSSEEEEDSDSSDEDSDEDSEEDSDEEEGESGPVDDENILGRIMGSAQQLGGFGSSGGTGVAEEGSLSGLGPQTGAIAGKGL